MSKQPVAIFDIDGIIFRSSLVIELTGALTAAGVLLGTAHKDYRKNLERKDAIYPNLSGWCVCH